MKVSRDQPGIGPIVTGFGPGGFRVGEERFRAVLLTATMASGWDPPPLDTLTVDELRLLIDVRPEFILLGTGATLRRPPRALTKALDALELGIEPMDSRAAARGWGVLRGEGRPVAAALICWPASIEGGIMRQLWIAALAAMLATPATAQAPAAASPAPTPDYGQDAAWLCRPGRQDACAVNQDVTVVAANGRTRVERFRRDPAPAFDCFYVYPTVSMDPTPNSDMTAGPEENQVAAAQAARFGAHCRVFAPLYRQVTLTALRQIMTGGTPAVDRGLALADVYAAWTDYLKRDNKGRGVVLIGHSQGSGLLKQLIAGYIEGQPVQRNIIAAYLAGTNVAVPPGQAVGGDLKRMPICTAAGQFGCVVAWTTFRADPPPPENSRFGKPVPPSPAGTVAACVNAAALGGGKQVTDAIFSAGGAGQSSAKQESWATGATVATPFVKVPGLISAECASQNGFNYLAVTVNADPKDPRTDTIVGDVVANGTILKDWGLHLLDMPVVMGNLVELSDAQAKAWRGIGQPVRK